MALAFRHLKLVLEPGGAVALAAALFRGEAMEGDAVIVVATGGNAIRSSVRGWCGPGGPGADQEDHQRWGAAVDEMLDGIVAAHPRHLAPAPGSPRAIVARDGPRPGKVGLVIGGGSGHEPTFLGFVGRGLADAAAVGNVFASPPPDPILACTRAVNGGAGVLYMYGNYAGDVMNFDMAAEMAAMEDIEVRTVLTTDDVASAPRERRESRRGVAGNFFIFKAAGAACDRMLPPRRGRAGGAQGERPDLHDGRRAGALLAAADARGRTSSSARTRWRSAWASTASPGVARGPLAPADAIVDAMMDRILDEMAAARGDRVAVLVNGLGATPLMELYIMNRRVEQRLDAAGIGVHATWVGNWCTSLEMAGASVTCMHLDEELAEMLDHPCDCAMFRVGVMASTAARCGRWSRRSPRRWRRTGTSSAGSTG